MAQMQSAVEVQNPLDREGLCVLSLGMCNNLRLRSANSENQMVVEFVDFLLSSLSKR